MAPEEVPEPLPDPSEHVPEHEKIPESWVADLPAFRAQMAAFQEAVEKFKRVVLWGGVALGVAFATIGLVAVLAFRNTSNLTQNIEDRALVRDAQQNETQARLDAQQHRLDELTAELSRQAALDKQVFCRAIDKAVADARAKGEPVDPNTEQFRIDYGCVSPGGGQ